MTKYYQKRFQQLLLATVPLFYFAPLQPLPVTALPSHPTANYQIAQDTEQKGIPYHRVGIGGITLGMTEAEVRTILGQPIKQEKDFYLPIAGDYSRTLRYGGLNIDLLEDSRDGKFYVYQLEATTSEYATIDGVRVGDTVEKVIAAYGNIGGDDDTGFSYKVDSESPVFFNISIENGIVTNIFCGDFLG
jgi:hypothetical protein